MHTNLVFLYDPEYQWQKLPQVSFLAWIKFCLNKRIFVVTKLLSWQIFVATNIILLWQNFCHNKLTFVATKHVFCHDKNVLVMTKKLWKKIVCSDKHNFTTTKVFCFDERRVLSWQTHVSIDKHMFVLTNMCWQNFCHDKNYTCGSSHQWYLKGSAHVSTSRVVHTLPPAVYCLLHCLFLQWLPLNGKFDLAS